MVVVPKGSRALCIRKSVIAGPRNDIRHWIVHMHMHSGPALLWQDKIRRISIACRRSSSAVHVSYQRNGEVVGYGYCRLTTATNLDRGSWKHSIESPDCRALVRQYLRG